MDPSDGGSDEYSDGSSYEELDEDDYDEYEDYDTTGMVTQYTD
jgi:hypothetical protein